ncbi:hypothetical protein [Parasutterella excrementihominis]|uniref:hypothetical protein n=1 Tax=Parasutterella excrementihominis TaxID=487175 RepID=UPI003A8E6428
MKRSERSYAKIFTGKWRSRSFRTLRGNPWAIVLQDYLMSCPASEMSGVFYMPKYLIEGELGIPHDELENAIRILEEADFCRFYDDEYVFVFNMARYQIADALSPDDNRWKSLMRDIEEMPDNIRREFIIRYNDDFNLGYQIIRKAAEPTAPVQTATQAENKQGEDKPLTTCQSTEDKGLRATSESENKPLNSQTQPELEPLVLESEAPCKPLIRPLQAPCKPVTVTVTETVAVTEEEVPVGKRRPATSRPRQATHRFDLSELPDDWRQQCEELRPDLDPLKVFAEFVYYWQTVNSSKGLRSDDGWRRTWLNHIKSVKQNAGNIKSAARAPAPVTPPPSLSEAAMAEMQKMRF